MAAWIDNPRALRLRSHMPRLFETLDGQGADRRASDAAAYLASLGKPKNQSKAGDPSAAKLGGQLFAQLDCIACHTLSDAPTSEQAADAERVSLRYVKSKFLPGALRQYLLNPAAHYAWNPMPNFRLSDDEATAIATYLESFVGTKLPESAAGDAARGREVVRSSGCLACHALGDEKTSMPASLALAQIANDHWQRGCMSTDSARRQSAPDFSLSDEQRRDLAAFAASGLASLDQERRPRLRNGRSTRCVASRVTRVMVFHRCWRRVWKTN